MNVSIKRALKELGMIEIGRLSKFYDPKSIDRNRVLFDLIISYQTMD